MKIANGLPTNSGRSEIPPCQSLLLEPHLTCSRSHSPCWNQLDLLSIVSNFPDICTQHFWSSPRPPISPSTSTPPRSSLTRPDGPFACFLVRDRWKEDWILRCVIVTPLPTFQIAYQESSFTVSVLRVFHFIKKRKAPVFGSRIKTEFHNSLSLKKE